jgi:outer membrane immunogenic protein
MKKILLGSVFVALSAGTAFATDMPYRAPAQVYSPAPAYSWTGLYGGFSAGYASGENKITDSVTGFATDKFKPAGGFGGVQLGYKSQFAPHWMMGGQVDVSAGSIDDNLTVGPASGKNTFNTFGTARTTFGYVQDRTLLYVTGGAIWLRDRFTATGALNTTDSTQYHVGWVWGGGIEYAFDPRWSVNLEYLYAPLDRSRDTSTSADTRRTDANFSIVRVGLNYRFNDGIVSASNMPVKAHAVPASQWNGGYLGVHVGYGWSTLDKTDGSLPLRADLNPSGGFGGMGGGYNWVYAPNSLIGIETDSSWGTLKQTRTGGGVTATNKVEDLGTARLRLGYLMNPDTLLYVTGGAAYAREKSTDSSGGDTKVDHLGWTAGVGAEYMFAPQWSVKAEWLYADLGKFTDNVGGLGAYSKQSDMTVAAAKVGINYYGPLIERLFTSR